jgi:membrane peptidoglycan carboxypeptidase
MVATLVSLLLVLALALGLWYYLDLVKNLPAINSLPALLEPPTGTLLQPTKMYDRSHQHVILTLENPAAQSRQYLRVSSGGEAGGNTLSPHLVDATIASLDPGFWSEPGYSLSGIAAGTSPTLAQQLVSKLLLYDQPASVKRAIQERLLAMQVMAQYGRQKVLEWYLNTAQYGAFVYGADAGSWVYLGKPATQLTLAEAAMLTSIVESPGLDPWVNGQLLREQQMKVIQAMLEHGLISEMDAQRARDEQVNLQLPRTASSLAPDFTNLVLLQLSSQIPLKRIYMGGYEIITSLDYDLQKQAECTARVQLIRLQGISNQDEPGDSIVCEAASLLPALQTANNKVPADIQTSVVVLDSVTGEILAWVGGADVHPAPAIPATHQAGTILSPFMYLAAFTQGMRPASLLWDLPTSGKADISDQVLATYHGPVRLRTAMVNDYSGAAAEVMQKIGIENVWQTEQKFGISTDLSVPPAGPTITGLNTQPVSLLEVVQAYGVLANQGVMAGHVTSLTGAVVGQAKLSPVSILQVGGSNGQSWLDWSTTQVRPIVSGQLAYLVTNVLSDEEARLASLAEPNVLEVERPAGVKVSLSEDGRDAWTVGYIPQLAVGVWVGASSNLNVEMAAGLWHAVLEYAAGRLPVVDFNIPEGISRVKVCVPSGLLVSTACQSQVDEVFLQGSEPTQEDNLYQEFLIDQQTGKLATIFTPSHLVDKKIFLVVPPQAKAWALAAGLPIPPDTYDAISPPVAVSNDANFSQPQMSTHVNGKVDFYGNATGEDFSYYQLQVGQGLDPQRWLQIGEDVHQPVQDGFLGSWNTTGLEGDYIVELLVVRQDLRFERAILQVSVDNSSPQVHILAPLDNDRLDLHAGEMLVVQADVSDDQGLQRVEFYIDGDLVSTLYEPPMVSLWPAAPGNHTVRVRAYDWAGNKTEAEIKFTIIN